MAEIKALRSVRQAVKAESPELPARTTNPTDLSTHQLGNVLKTLREVLSSPGHRSWLNAEIKRRVGTALRCDFGESWDSWFGEKIDKILCVGDKTLVGGTDKRKPVMFKLVSVARLLAVAALSHFVDELSFSLACREVREALIPLAKRATVHFGAASPGQIDAMCRILRLHDISITNDPTILGCIREHGNCENVTKVLRSGSRERERE